MVIICTTTLIYCVLFNTHVYLAVECICVFRTVLRTNSCYLHKQRQLINLCHEDALCSVWDNNCILQVCVLHRQTLRFEGLKRKDESRYKVRTLNYAVEHSDLFFTAYTDVRRVFFKTNADKVLSNILISIVSYGKWLTKQLTK